MKDLLNKKWHLHLLTLPIGILFILYAKQGFLYLNKVGDFWLGALVIFFSLFAASGIEMVEGLLGANRTKKEVVQSRLDILACIIGGILSVVVGGNLDVALYSFITIVVIEIYRKLVIKNNYGINIK